MNPLQVGDAQRAGEVDVVDGDAQADINGLSIFLPVDRDGQITWTHHTGNEDPVTDGVTRELKGLDEGRDWGRGGRIINNYSTSFNITAANNK